MNIEQKRKQINVLTEQIIQRRNILFGEYKKIEANIIDMDRKISSLKSQQEILDELLNESEKERQVKAGIENDLGFVSSKQHPNISMPVRKQEDERDIEKIQPVPQRAMKALPPKTAKNSSVEEFMDKVADQPLPEFEDEPTPKPSGGLRGTKLYIGEERNQTQVEEDS